MRARMLRRWSAVFAVLGSGSSYFGHVYWDSSDLSGFRKVCFAVSLLSVVSFEFTASVISKHAPELEPVLELPSSPSASSRGRSTSWSSDPCGGGDDDGDGGGGVGGANHARHGNSAGVSRGQRGDDNDDDNDNDDAAAGNESVMLPDRSEAMGIHSRKVIAVSNQAAAAAAVVAAVHRKRSMKQFLSQARARCTLRAGGCFWNPT
jgi:hypothetical protein